MTISDLLTQLSKLNIWQKGGQRAPHKPLLLLLYLARLQQKQQCSLEASRNKKRHTLFDQQNEIGAKHEAWINRLEEKLSHQTENEELFTIRWSIH